MEEINYSKQNLEAKIDMTEQTPEEPALANEQPRHIFRFSHTTPGTPEYDRLMQRISPPR